MFPGVCRMHSLSAPLRLLLLGWIALLPSHASAAFLDVTEEALGLTPQQVPGWVLVVWADYNGDGWSDLHNGPETLFVNNGDGTFTQAGDIGLEVEDGYGYRSVWADADNDGDLDLVQSCDMHSMPGAPSRVYYYENSGAPEHLLDRSEIFAFPENNRGQTAVFVDGDGDSYYELYQTSFGNWSPDYGRWHDVYFEADGTGVWTDVTSACIPELMENDFWRHARGVVTCDYDRDRDMDIFVPNYGVAFGENWENLFWQNDGSGQFVDVAAEAGVAIEPHGAYGIGLASGASWGDYDNDGDMDLVTANIHGWLGLYRNEGDGTFTNVSEGAGFLTPQLEYHNCLWADLENDGDLDLLACTWSGGIGFIYENEGPENLGHFRLATTDYGLDYTTVFRNTWGFAMADYDRDGDLDLYYAGGRDEYNGRYLFRNDVEVSEPDAHWLICDVRGDGLNCGRSALGAQVQLEFGDAWSGMRQVECTSSDGTANMRPVHFGLGARESFCRLYVHWPYGDTEFWTFAELGAAVDQYVVLLQGSGHVMSAPDEAIREGSRLRLRLAGGQPTTGALAVRLRSSAAGIAELAIFDLAGRRLIARPCALQRGVWQAQKLNLDGLAAGAYFLRAAAAGEVATQRVVLVSD
ncbi:MAG: hypothetical protein GF330_08825 [Candidatus Eisenbacteria bacterium]|nr:hypothetical protein [Candidatus Eisenbacteria bacterium]